MKIQRIITAEGKSGVATKIDTIDTAKVDFLTNLWGFDKVPDLPLTPEQVFGDVWSTRWYSGRSLYAGP
jgi:hypothetical protein